MIAETLVGVAGALGIALEVARRHQGKAAAVSKTWLKDQQRKGDALPEQIVWHWPVDSQARVVPFPKKPTG